MRDQVEEPYEEVASWGQAVKGDEVFADLAFQRIGEPKVLRRGLTVEAVARAVSREQGIALERMLSRGHGRREAAARAAVAWAGQEVGGISIARAAKYFRRETSSLTRGVEKLRERMRGSRALSKAGEELVDRL